MSTPIFSVGEMIDDSQFWAQSCLSVGIRTIFPLSILLVMEQASFNDKVIIGRVQVGVLHPSHCWLANH